jgi:D-aminopeptidase
MGPQQPDCRRPGPPVKKPRGRELGLPFPGTPGPLNAITDVPGVMVGFTTLDGVSADGKTIKTGVTAILPRGHLAEPQPVWAGLHRFNGNGEMTGTHWIEDAGYFFGPVCVTNTHSVGIVHHAAVRWMIRQYASAWAERPMWAMPVVAETYDGQYSDIDGQHVTEAHALAALDGAQGGPVAEGNVGGGNGMRCYKFKGGTGTSSRVFAVDDHRYTVAALVQTNHGVREVFTVLGVPVGEHMPLDGGEHRELGSIIIVVATDVPLLPHQLQRVARRAAIGFGRNGTYGGNSSGDIFLAFSTANAKPLPQFSPNHLSMAHLNDQACDAVYLGTVQAVEEAVINSMLAAEPTPELRPGGPVCPALDHDELMRIMARYGRLRG